MASYSNAGRLTSYHRFQTTFRLALPFSPSARAAVFTKRAFIFFLALFSGVVSSIPHANRIAQNYDMNAFLVMTYGWVAAAAVLVLVHKSFVKQCSWLGDENEKDEMCHTRKHQARGWWQRNLRKMIAPTLCYYTVQGLLHDTRSKIPELAPSSVFDSPSHWVEKGENGKFFTADTFTSYLW